MYATSLLFGLACAVSFPWIWKTPDLMGWILMLGLGVIAAIGQFILYEGVRHAPASALAPIEYTGLIWAFTFGYAIWSEVPAVNVFKLAPREFFSALNQVTRDRRIRRRNRAIENEEHNGYSR
jgi:S-adenosylmethionine uptake transporter